MVSKFLGVWIVACLLEGFITAYPVLTEGDVDNVKAAAKALFRDPSKMPDGRTQVLLAQAIRLAFHDCVGGCDGCINLDNKENRGLEYIVSELNGMYTDDSITNPTFNKIMSRADFWGLVFVAAVEEAADNRLRADGLPKKNYSPKINFRWGRKDCLTSPSTDEVFSFPNAHGDLDDTLEFFRENFPEFRKNSDNVNDESTLKKHTVAIIGAHSVGAAHKKASGFVGKWVAKSNSLDNSFYKVLVDLDHVSWIQINTAKNKKNPRWQWNSVSDVNIAATNMMFNSDMSLFVDLKPDEETGEELECAIINSKTVNTTDDPNNPCEDFSFDFSETAQLVRKYAEDERAWLDDFAEAFRRMIHHLPEEETTRLYKIGSGPKGSSPDELSLIEGEDENTDFPSYLKQGMDTPPAIPPENANLYSEEEQAKIDAKLLDALSSDDWYHNEKQVHPKTRQFNTRGQRLSQSELAQEGMQFLKKLVHMVQEEDEDE